MNAIIQIFTRLLGIILFITFVNKILQFFGLETKDYIFYNFWLLALLIFYNILPQNYKFFT